MTPVHSPAAVMEAEIGDRAAFEARQASNGPFVMRGLVRDWPLYLAGRQSTDALRDYLLTFYNGDPVHLMTAPSSIEGRLFYDHDFRRLNFRNVATGFREALAAIQALPASGTADTVYMGSAAENKHWPGLARQNPMPLLGDDVNPNLWIGGRTIVGPHNDYPENIACVVAGRRRFRVFPPDQIANLYIGPYELNPAGRPVSFVSPTDPDHARYPRYAQALGASSETILEPGDAIFIPSMWWHSVESLEPFNMLVNYWWETPGASSSRGEAALVHALLAMAHLADHQRLAWRAVFEHLVFRVNGDPTAHIPDEIQGMLGKLTPDLRDKMRALIRRSLME
jgi:hypothetical protein